MIFWGKNCYICFVLLFLAPGSYDVEKSEKIVHQSSGAITFGIKYKDQKHDDIPGKSDVLYDFPSFCSKMFKDKNIFKYLK